MVTVVNVEVQRSPEKNAKAGQRILLDVPLASSNREEEEKDSTRERYVER